MEVKNKIKKIVKVMSIVSIGVFSAVAGVNANLSDGLVLHYDLENSGAMDLSGNENDGISYGGQNGSNFEGVADYIETTGFSINGPEITISAYVNTNSIQAYSSNILAIHSGSNNYNWGDKFISLSARNNDSGGGINFKDQGTGGDGGYYSRNYTFEPNTWNLATLVKNNNSINYYVDGVLFNSINTESYSEFNINNGLLHIGDGNYYQGSLHYGHRFTGSIKEVRIYDRVLSQNEIIELANGFTSNEASTSAELNVIDGQLSIGAPSLINFGDIVVSNTEQIVEIDLVDDNYFFVEDLKASSLGYYTTLSISDLSSGNKKISAENVELMVFNGNISTLAGTPDSNVICSLFNYSTFGSDSPVVLMERSDDSSGIVGMYGVLPSFKVTIPKYQAKGKYTGTLTYTLIEN